MIYDLCLGSILLLKAALGITKGDEGYATGDLVAREIQRRTLGTIVAFIGDTLPSGSLFLNGQQFLKSYYPELSTLLTTASAEFRVANDSLRFQLPDLRGLFLRGGDEYRGLDANRVLYTVQWHELASHSHYINRNIALIDNNDGPMKGFQSGGYWGTERIAMKTLSTEGAGGGETRPMNYAIRYAIYY